MSPRARLRNLVTLVALALPLLPALQCAPRSHRGAKSAKEETVASASASSSKRPQKSAPSSSSSSKAVASASASASSSVLSANALPPLPEPTSVALEADPELARVSFLSAIIGPGRVGGAQWDRVGTVPDDVWREVRTAMRSDDPYGSINAFLSSGGFAALGRPDVKGKVTLLLPFGDRSIDLPQVDDTFTPRWSGVEFRRVPLDKRTRLRMEFTEVNSTSDPVIGVAELDGAALQKIDAAGKVVAWPFADQTGNQVLFVMVSVVPE